MTNNNYQQQATARPAVAIPRLLLTRRAA